MTMPARNASIDGLRGVLAAYIMATHYTESHWDRLP